MPDAQRIRCLLIDDDQAAFFLTQAIMDQIPWADFELEWVGNYEEGEAALARGEHDVYLIDYLIGESSGIALARRAREAGNRAPMILLTGKGRYEVDVEAMEAGLSDYLDKTKVDPDLMERSIRYAMDRARAEQALRESEQRHRSMFDHLPIGLYRTTLDGELLDANPALAQLLGHPDRETLAIDYARNFFVSPSQRQAFLDRLDQFGVIRGFESDLKRPDGRTIRVRCAARAHRGSDGRTLYIEGAVEDVSTEVEAHELHGQASRFRWIYEGSGLAILVLDLDGTIRHANPAFLRAFGYDAAGLVGTPLAELAEDEDAEALRAGVSALASERQERAEGQRRLKAADGAPLWARVRMGLVRTMKGHPDHLLALFEDVAEA